MEGIFFLGCNSKERRDASGLWIAPIRLAARSMNRSKVVGALFVECINCRRGACSRIALSKKYQIWSKLPSYI